MQKILGAFSKLTWRTIKTSSLVDKHNIPKSFDKYFKAFY